MLSTLGEHFWILSGVWGAVLGSFLQATVARYRLRKSLPELRGHLLQQQPSPEVQAAVEASRLSPWSPARSFCFACGQEIPWFRNLPIVSVLQQQARCAQCGISYGWSTLVWEVGGLGIGALWGGFFPPGIVLLATFGFSFGSLALSLLLFSRPTND